MRFAEYFLITVMIMLCGAIFLLYNLTDQPTPLPTIAQIQQELVNRGHGIEVDGELGDKTQEAWNAETDKGIIYRNFESVMEADRKAKGL